MLVLNLVKLQQMQKTQIRDQSEAEEEYFDETKLELLQKVNLLVSYKLLIYNLV